MLNTGLKISTPLSGFEIQVLTMSSVVPVSSGVLTIHIFTIAPEKALLFQTLNVHYFLISPQKHWLWVLGRSTSSRCF